MNVSNVQNPYDDILSSNKDDPTRIQAFCHSQRNDRNAKFRAKMLHDSFEGVQSDPILTQIVNKLDYVDPRNCLVFWARPTAAVKKLILECQRRLQELSPNIWLMPQDCLHMTTLELAHSLTPDALDALVSKLKPSIVKPTGFFHEHPTRLVKPMLSFDDTAVAFSFVPAAGEIQDGKITDDSYTYLHLRRDLINLCREMGLEVNARYARPSSHLTIARFITDEDHGSAGKPSSAAMASWVSAIEELNEMLARDYWPHDGHVRDAGNWIVGAERGLDIREGTLWYGGGQSLYVGDGLRI